MVHKLRENVRTELNCLRRNGLNEMKYEYFIKVVRYITSIVY